MSKTVQAHSLQAAVSAPTATTTTQQPPAASYARRRAPLPKSRASRHKKMPKMLEISTAQFDGESAAVSPRSYPRFSSAQLSRRVPGREKRRMMRLGNTKMWSDDEDDGDDEVAAWVEAVNSSRESGGELTPPLTPPTGGLPRSKRFENARAKGAEGKKAETGSESGSVAV
jgi:hypothetical protein